MTVRKRLFELLSNEPRTASSLARELGLGRGDIDDHLHHLIKSAEAAGQHVVVEPARCKSCGFVFGADKLTKPGKCPQCRGSRLFEPRLHIEPSE